ncbi:NADPH-dependent FMN reductase [uncultured Dubosiella sp.]|uniref:NADPH-dependent FMN reductase n=1 Tax=uncultured Dubosiella sp. TaxID=1937011 RepID=UPI0025966677|nr:NADPH-dependent FMN reductase [uncultured Dubosiella sp.]
MTTIKKITILIGSLRKHSLNRQLAVMAQAALQGKAECVVFDPAEIPLFDQDHEFPAPEKIKRMRDAIHESDGVWIFTPEYNGQLPGGLKNALDWLSRPLKENDPDWKDTAVWGKKATMSGVGGKNATKSVQEQLLSLLKFMGMDVMTQDRAQIAMSPQTMETSDLALTEGVHEAIDAQARAFLEFLK